MVIIPGRCNHNDLIRGRSIKQNEVSLISKLHLHVTRQCGRLQMPFSLLKRIIREIEISQGFRTRLMGVQSESIRLMRTCSKKIPPTPFLHFVEETKMKTSESNENKEAQERSIQTGGYRWH
jgi:hypothetical protein